MLTCSGLRIKTFHKEFGVAVHQLFSTASYGRFESMLLLMRYGQSTLQQRSEIFLQRVFLLPGVQASMGPQAVS